jgi:hypothetical protein
MQSEEQPAETLQTESRQFLWSWKDIALVTLAAVILLFLSAVALTIVLQRVVRIPIQINDAPLAYYAGLAFIEAIALIASVYLFGLYRRKFSWSSVGFNTISSRWLFRASVAAMAAIPIAGATAAVVQMILNRPVESPQLDFILPKDFSWLGAAGMFIAAGFLVPLAEELFFRGLIYTWMRQSLSVWIAIPLNALVFGLVHGEISVTVATGLLGIVLAWFYERSKSLWAPILIHALVNSVQLGFIYVMVAIGIA